MKISKAPLILCIIICASLLISICSFSVGQNQAAIITTLGKQRSEMIPGLHGKLPWPFEKIRLISTSTQNFTGSPRDIPSSDNVILSSQLSASWKITDPLRFYNRLGTISEAQTQLKPIIESSQESILRSVKRDELFSSEGMKKVETRLLAQFNEKTTEAYGITFSFAGITRISLPAKNTQNILNRMRSERIKEATIILSEASSKAKITRNNAETAKAKILAKAAAEARRKQGTSLVTITEEYEKHLEHKDFILFLKKLDALGEVSRYDTTLFIDPSTPIYDILETPVRKAPTTESK